MTELISIGMRLPDGADLCYLDRSPSCGLEPNRPDLIELEDNGDLHLVSFLYGTNGWHSNMVPLDNHGVSTVNVRASLDALASGNLPIESAPPAA